MADVLQFQPRQQVLPEPQYQVEDLYAEIFGISTSLGPIVTFKPKNDNQEGESL